MGLSGIGPTELLVVLAIVIMLFGTKRLRTLGSDLGTALKSFRSAMAEGESDKQRRDDTATPEVGQQDEKAQAGDVRHHT